MNAAVNACSRSFRPTRSSTQQRGAFGAASSGAHAWRISATSQKQQQASARGFVEDFANAGLGQVRFIVIGEGAILESVSTLNGVSVKDIPNRGPMATISTADKSFECHLVLNKLKEARLAKVPAKTGGHSLYATRFVNADDKVVLSCILHGPGGAYEDSAVQAWTALQEKYGDTVAFTAEHA